MNTQSAILIIGIVALAGTFIGTLLAIAHFDSLENQDEDDYETT